MKIIDFHSHIDDILCGGDIIDPYVKRVWTPGDIFPASEYRVAGMKGPFAKISHHLEAIYIGHHLQYGTIDNMAREMKEFGVDKSILSPIAPLTDGFQYLKKVKGDKRFLVFASVSPHDPDKEKKLKAQMDAGCAGLKLHPVIQNAAPDHQGYFELLEIFRPYKLPVLVHSGVVSYYVAYQPVRYSYGQPKKFEKLIQAFPDVAMVMGHMGMKEGRQVIEFARNYSHIYADGSNQKLTLLKEGLDAFGEDRLMFGSDWAFSKQSVPISIGMKLTAGNPGFREKYFWKNATSLIPKLKDEL